MTDPDELKKKKIEELKKQQQGEDVQDQQQEMRKQLKQIASQILTKEARSRLGNVRAAKPDLASQVELQLVQLHRSGSIQGKINEDQLIEILKKIKSKGNERDIKYR